MKFDFAVTGLPGSSTCFWAHVLTQDSVSFCYHEYEGTDKKTPNNQNLLVGNSSPTISLMHHQRAAKYVIIERDPEEAMKSFVRRYKTDSLECRKLFEQVTEQLSKLGAGPVLKIPYESEFSVNTMRQVFTFCTGRKICDAHLYKMSRSRILSFE